MASLESSLDEPNCELLHIGCPKRERLHVSSLDPLKLLTIPARNDIPSLTKLVCIRWLKILPVFFIHVYRP